MIRIGQGYDVHRLVNGRKLILAGVQIEHDKGLLGHSDADVLTHAIMDSLLGAASMGDIGKHFPDTDDKYKGADSLKLLSHVCDMLSEKGFDICNIDSTVVAQKPKLKDYIEEMQKNIANTCRVDLSKINIKATTEENLGFTGKEEGISAMAVCLLQQK